MRPLVKTPNLTYWLRGFEGVVSVRVVTQDDKQRILKVNPKSKRPFAEMRRTIEALNPKSVEALDKQGAVLGALSLGPTEEEQAEEEQEEQEELQERAAAHVDSQAELMKAFAGHIAEAYRHSTHVAFDKFVDVFTQTNKSATERQMSLERSLGSLERTLARQSRELAARAEENAPTEDSFVQTLIAGAIAGQQAKEPAEPKAKANGVKEAVAVAAAKAAVDAMTAAPPANDDDEGE